GGFTTVCCMPNTYPVNDNASVTEFIIRKAAQEGLCTVLPIGAITKGQKGEELAEMGTMRDEGCIAFSDDGQPVMNSLIMRRALEYSRAFSVPIISHCEDLTLSEGGVMNEGLLSVTLGLRGIPAEAEVIMVYRDISLTELTGGRLHIAHVSTEGSVKLIRDAKKRGVNVTAETCPHYFSITEDAVRGYDTNAKVNPPLRTKRDIKAVKEGLQDGTIDVIATDHAPHHMDEKLQEFDKAPSGISGLETALGLSMKLVEEGVLTMSQLVEKMALNPANILDLIINGSKGTLKPKYDADIVILDVNKKFKIEPERFASMGKNSPFCGWILKGTPVITICKGNINDIS
ncbi:MAG: dihydroorotase, partial [Nitrospirota bacterium]